MNYNTAFFGLFENIFILLKREYGEETAIKYFTELMEKGLSKSYGDNFKKGEPEIFKRLVSERDKMVGLRVDFPDISKDRLVYRFLDDPFPNLRGVINHSKLDYCYMNFKVKHILGDNWKYETTKHIWKGDDFTEHVITLHNKTHNE